MNEQILVINPGSTSTKIALYIENKPIWMENITHSVDELQAFECINDQYGMRLQLITDMLTSRGTDLPTLNAVVARGGLLPPVKSGAYLINEAMMDCLKNRPRNQHASNLGAALASEIASRAGKPAYIYDPVTVDEMIPLVRITGIKQIIRRGVGHNLNMRAAAIHYSEQVNRPYPTLNLIVAHLGGGITMSLHCQGQMIDMISDDEGPFSPERAGGLPAFQLLDLAFNGTNDKKSLMKQLQRNGGLMSFFQTSDARLLEAQIEKGDHEAELVYRAMALNIGKNIAKLAVTAQGAVDAIILTGGLAYSQRLTNWIKEDISFIAPVNVIAGENELAALANGALRVLRGEETARHFIEEGSGEDDS
jgi:butyrate kinase